MATTLEKQLEVLSNPIKIKNVIFKNGGIFDDCHNWISLSSGKIAGVVKLNNQACAVLFKSECQSINLVTFDDDNVNLQVSNYSIGEVYFGKLNKEGVDRYNDSITFDNYKIERFTIIRTNSIHIDDLSQDEIDDIFNNKIYTMSMTEEEDNNLNCNVQNSLYHDPLECIMHDLLAMNLDTALNTLTDREAKILRLRFGLEDGIPKSLAETSELFNVTNIRIRQIQEKALMKLRNSPKVRKLRIYIED